MAKNFYYYYGSMKMGPVTGIQLQEYAQLGRIRKDTVIEGENGRKSRAVNVAGLSFPVEETPPQGEVQSPAPPAYSSLAFGERTSAPPPELPQSAPNPAALPGRQSNGKCQQQSDYDFDIDLDDVNMSNIGTSSEEKADAEVVGSIVGSNEGPIVGPLVGPNDEPDVEPDDEQKYQTHKARKALDSRCKNTDGKINIFNGFLSLIAIGYFLVFGLLGGACGAATNPEAFGIGFVVGGVAGLIIWGIAYMLFIFPFTVHIELLQQIRDELRQRRDY